MTGIVLPPPAPRRLHLGAGRHAGARAGVKWGACCLLVVLLHAAALFWLGQAEPAAGLASPEAVMLDLAPEPAAPMPASPNPASATPQAPPQPAAETVQPPDPAPLDPAPPDPAPPDPAPPDPVPPAEPPPPDPAPPIDVPPPMPPPPILPPPMTPMAPPAEAVLTPPPPPPPRPAHVVPPRARPDTHPRPPSPPAASAPAADPAPPGPAATTPASAPPGQTQATWQARLLAHLARFKRFPEAAQRRGEQGTVLMRFTVMNDGSVLAMSMVRSSGYADLDEAAGAWMTRAQPLPAFPPEMTARQLELVVPLRFMLR